MSQNSLENTINKYQNELQGETGFVKDFKLTKDGKVAYKDIDIGEGRPFRIFLVGPEKITPERLKELSTHFNEERTARIAKCVVGILGKNPEKSNGVFYSLGGQDMAMTKTKQKSKTETAKDKHETSSTENAQKYEVITLDDKYFKAKEVKHASNPTKLDKHRLRKESLEELSKIFDECVKKP